MSDNFSVIDVPADAAQAEEAMGTKFKFWYDDPQFGDCLFKCARRNTGEDWSEKIAAELCTLLGLPHATYELATWQGQPGTISPNLLPPNTVLIHGNDILAGLVSSYPRDAGYNLSQHTLSLVLTALRQPGVRLPLEQQTPANIDSAVATFIGYLLLDAWIGNGDRHHENWGFVVSLPDGIPHLSPTYDHASCLGRELQDQKRQQRIAQDTVRDYAARSRSAFYRQAGDPKPMLTFDVFETVMGDYPQSAARWLDQLAQISPEQTKNLLNRIPSHRLSPTALEFACQMLDINRSRLLHLREALM
jgi:hypothetical protein